MQLRDFLHKVFKDCFTGKDNETYDIGRIIWFMAVASYLFLSFMDVLFTGDFEYSDFGIGLGAILGFGGLSIKLKSDTEPSK